MLNFKFSALAAIYAANVLDGGRTIEEVPSLLAGRCEECPWLRKKLYQHRFIYYACGLGLMIGAFLMGFFVGKR
ncbi:hypothetical protein [Levilactobacillus brevis]|uniref:hypothetical protein n=1 Tax=Levilactobacillus brevis TaxID=1580 RepID=UPI0004B09E9A|nr:hypothetical protein [Levilactobacillus brevis]